MKSYHLLEDKLLLLIAKINFKDGLSPLYIVVLLMVFFLILAGWATGLYAGESDVTIDYSFFDVSVDLTDAGHGRVLYSSLFSIDISTKIWNNFLMLNRCYHFVVTKKKKRCYHFA